MAKCSSSAILPCMLSPLTALGRRRPVKLNTLLPRILCRENRTRPSWHGFGHPLGGAPCLVPFRGKETTAAHKETTAAQMNIHHNYTLASRPQTSRVLRGWAELSRGTFSGAIFLTDVALRVDVVPDRYRLSPRRLSRARPHLVLHPGRRFGGQHLRRNQPVPPRIPAAELLQLQG